ncbi:MAG TPA: hypothetical protein VHO70_15180 [Chitinispirillaceae bacterium]|nr:hypothetical protein [Chitinispirillaceae bacterium]
MKTLVVYYSKTGTTKKLAEKLAAALKADTEILVDKKKRTGFIGWLLSGRDGIKKVPTMLNTVSKKAADYDVVLIGGPLWGFKSIAPAARTYLMNNRDSIKKAGFFMTFAGTSCNDAFSDLKSVYGKNILGTLEIRQRDIDNTTTEQKVKEFTDLVKTAGL